MSYLQEFINLDLGWGPIFHESSSFQIICIGHTFSWKPTSVLHKLPIDAFKVLLLLSRMECHKHYETSDIMIGKHQMPSGKHRMSAINGLHNDHLIRSNLLLFDIFRGKNWMSPAYGRNYEYDWKTPVSFRKTSNVFL